MAAVDVGSGAPSDQITQRFINAFYRNNFAYLVSLPPLADVKRLGNTGLVQEFQNAAKTPNVKLALVKANSSAPAAENDVVQVLSDIYTYYNTLGVNTVGYPTGDTLGCPVTDDNTCTYQLFDKSYVLFAYKSSTLNGQNFAIFTPLYTKWIGLGGIAGLGRPVDIQRTGVTANSVTATTQIFINGALYSITSGSLNGQTFAVTTPIYSLYTSYGGHTGFLGFPTSDDIPIPNNRRRQTFQGGTIEYPVGGAPELRLPVASVLITTSAAGGALRLNLGDTAEINATTLGANGGQLSGRPVSWATSNSRVVTIQPNGTAATLKAVGGGTANVTASSEGQVSPALQVIVASQCCQIGEGAPTAAIQQAFQDAVTRNRLSILLPTASPVRRSGNGYVQDLMSTDGATRYLLGKPDRVASAYYIAGDILTRYLALGGPPALGLPISDPTAAGRQLFENNLALAGSPVRMVTDPLLSKWSVLNYETGVVGPPVADSAIFVTLTGTAGISQAFSGGALFAATNGSRAGQGYFSSGLILTRYLALGGPSGNFGLPTSDEFGTGGQRRQNFEGGYIDYALGDAAAQEHEASRTPAVSATPGTVSAGERVRLAVTGFANGATIRVSASGQQDFTITTQNGSFSWEIYVPLSARTGAVTVVAADSAAGVTATTSYNVRGLEQRRLQLSKLQGDGQTGVPGARLPQPLRVKLADDAGNPIIGAPIMFRASPGAAILSASAVTDETGQASATVRLQAQEGLALITAESVNAVTTFSGQAAAFSLTNFPRQTQTVPQRGALLTAAASILRYYQNRSDVPSPNGLADPVTLNTVLTGLCVTDAQGTKVCDGYVSSGAGGEQVLNPWRLANFVGGKLDVTVERPDLTAVRDLLAVGTPALLALALSTNGAPNGGNYVVAIGVSADGSILIHDPNPAYARNNLSEYFNGFSADGVAVRGELTAVLRLAPSFPSTTRFLAVAPSQPAASLKSLTFEMVSQSGPCASYADLPDVSSPAVSRFLYCDGAQAAYEFNVGGAAFRGVVTDLVGPGGARDVSGSALTAYKINHVSGALTVAPQDVSFSTSSVVNAATFKPVIAPGGLVSIFGAGLGISGGSTTATLGDQPMTLLAVSPFQINGQIPPSAPTGANTLRITSPFGSAEQPVTLAETAPGIFVLGTVRGGAQGAVVNQNGTLNTLLSPALRGQVITVYCTGLGAVARQGSLDSAVQPVVGVVNGQEIAASFAGLTPGFVGLYQVNLPLPASIPPGIDLSLFLRQNRSDSNAVLISVQ